MLAGNGKGAETLSANPMESHGGLRIAMAFPALTGFKGFNPVLSQDLNRSPNASVQRGIKVSIG